jgi:DNA mismatch repair protein MutL
MPEIKLLNQETIDKIAAGEVVERPSSVVKELVENAIDAKATAITVEIKEGGTSFIRITDNGSGIEHAQVPIAFLRHSTSKIRQVEDLLSITSLGFRGEALSSIAAVSQVELITKTYGELTGTRYVIEGSKEVANEEIGAPEGTTFLVRNLFYNVPARRKFLKTAQTEGNYISDLMERLALSHPDVSFKFISNGQTKMHTAGNSKEKDLIYHIYGRDITAALLPIEQKTPLFEVHGFIGKPLISRGNRNYENYFINGRYIKSALLSKAIEEAYKGFVMQHQYPFCVLYFNFETELLDVNVHPTKMELRFSDNEKVYHVLFDIIRKALTHKDFIPDVPVEEKKPQKREPIAAGTPEPFERRRMPNVEPGAGVNAQILQQAASQQVVVQQTVPQQATGQHPSLQSAVLHPTKTQPAENQSVFDKLLKKEPAKAAEENTYQVKPKEPETGIQQNPVMPEQDIQTKRAAEPVPEASYEQQSFLTKEARKEHRILGQLFDTYWLVQYEDKLFIIDQHAAHEKVLYEKTMERVKKKTFSSQTLSPPTILTLNAQEEEMLERYREEITTFGYEVEPFGGKEYAVTAVPADFTDIDMRSMFVEMLDDFANISGADAPNLIMEKVASMSCKAAIKGNQAISRSEMEVLIDELLQLENPYNCPHGRPTIIAMSKYEIEKKFKRIV